MSLYWSNRAGNGNPLQYSGLENSMNRRAWWAAVHGVTKSQAWLKYWAHLHTGAYWSPWNSPGQNTRVGSLSHLQGIFPTQGPKPGLLHCRWILYQLSYEGSPIPLEVRALLICPQRALGFISLKVSNSFNVVSLAGMCFTNPLFTTQTRGYGLCLDNLFSLHKPAQGCGWSRGLKCKFC